MIFEHWLFCYTLNLTGNNEKWTTIAKGDNTNRVRQQTYLRMSKILPHSEQDFTEIVEKQKKHLNTTFYTAHVLHTYVKRPYSDSLQIC